MIAKDKIDLYEMYRSSIYFSIKNHPRTRSMWRKLFWTTVKNSNEYKVGCIDIYSENWPELFRAVVKNKYVD